MESQEPEESNLSNFEKKIDTASTRLSALKQEHQESQVRQARIEKELHAIMKKLGISIPKETNFDFTTFENNPALSSILKRIIDQYLHAEHKFISPFRTELLKVIEPTPPTLLLSLISPANYVTFNSQGMPLVFGSTQQTTYGIKRPSILGWDMTATNPLSPKGAWNISQILSLPVSISGRVFSIARSSDDRTIAVGSQYGEITLWNASTKKKISKLNTGNNAPIYAIAFSYDNKTLATCGPSDFLITKGLIKLWDIATRKNIVTLTTDNSVYSVAFSPDNKILAYGHWGRIEFFDIPSNKVLQEIPAHKDNVTALAFSPDGKILASGSSDWIIKLWDVASKNKINALVTDKQRKTTSLAFSPDGKTLAIEFDDTTLMLWDITSNQHQQPSMTVVLDFLKTLSQTNNGVKKFILLDAIFESNAKTDGEGKPKESKPLDIYQPEVIAVLKDLPDWLQKSLQSKRMVRVFKKIEQK